MVVSTATRRVFSNTDTFDDLMADEVMAFCPSCKAFQTVWFTGGTLNQTRKFTQYGKHVYHDCGSNEPCRMYLTV